MAQLDLKRCNIRIKDGSGEYLDVKIGEGNLTYSEKRNMQYTLDRGILDEVREGDQVPVDVKLDFTWTYLQGAPRSGEPPSVENALKNNGNAVAWVSSDADACKPYAVDIEITFTPTPFTCGDREIITLADFRYESLDHDMKNATVSVSGKCNVTKATVTRLSQTPEINVLAFYINPSMPGSIGGAAIYSNTLEFEILRNSVRDTSYNGTLTFRFDDLGSVVIRASTGVTIDGTGKMGTVTITNGYFRSTAVHFDISPDRMVTIRINSGTLSQVTISRSSSGE